MRLFGELISSPFLGKVISFQFPYVRVEVYLVMVWQKNRQFGLNTLKQGLFTKPIIIVLQTYFWMSRCGGGSQLLC